MKKILITIVGLIMLVSIKSNAQKINDYSLVKEAICKKYMLNDITGEIPKKTIKELKKTFNNRYYQIRLNEIIRKDSKTKILVTDNEKINNKIFILHVLFINYKKYKFKGKDVFAVNLFWNKFYYNLFENNIYLQKGDVDKTTDGYYIASPNSVFKEISTVNKLFSFSMPLPTDTFINTFHNHLNNN